MRTARCATGLPSADLLILHLIEQLIWYAEVLDLHSYEAGLRIAGMYKGNKKTREKSASAQTMHA